MNRLLFVLTGLLLAHAVHAADHTDSAGKVKEFPDLKFAKADGKQLLLDLYIPEGVGKPPLVVWIHGGGWRGGSRKGLPLKDVCRHGYAIASISYRFTDQAVFPAQIHDCKAAIRWLRAHSDHYGYNAEWIAVAGSSAGGHLALLCGTSGDVEALEGKTGDHLDQSSRVEAVLAYYGLSDFVLRGKTHPKRHYAETSGSFALLGGKQDGKVNPELEKQASPAQYVSTDDPPLLAFHGKKDSTVLFDQSERIVELYRQAGLPAQLLALEKSGHGGKAFYTGKNFEIALDFLNLHCPQKD